MTQTASSQSNGNRKSYGNSGSGEPTGRSPDSNPLLSRSFTIPFREIGAQHVEPGVREILARAEAEIDDLAGDSAPRTWENTLQRLDKITQQVSEALHPLHLLLSVAETPPLRKAYNAVLPEIAGFWSRLPLNARLWEQVESFSRASEAHALTGIRARHLEKTLREFRRAGADLPPKRKDRLHELQVELARLQQRFSENVLDATAAFELLVTDEGRLEGLPAGPRQRFRQAAKEKGATGWLLTLDFPSYEPVMKHCVDRALREELHRAYVSRCRHDSYDNVSLVPRILGLRQEIAEILGYRDFPDYRLEDAMAKSGQRAVEFEDELVQRTRPYWERDLRQLEEHAAELGLGKLEPWDVAFVTESLRRRRYAIDDEALRPYFPLPSVLDGLFGLVRRVFGLRVSEAENPQVWHADVRFYDVEDDNGTRLGSFYTDWFPRKEKRQGAWMQDLLTGGPRPDGSFAPNLGFIAGNFSPAEGGRPALLTHREVQTIFHEFGHLLHHLTSRVPVPGRAGLNVAWDWVELPSQLMENWTWETEALALFARHYETGEALPAELLEKMLAARRFQGGWRQMRQLGFGTLDLALHAELAPELRDDDAAESSGEPAPEPALESGSGSASESRGGSAPESGTTPGLNGEPALEAGSESALESGGEPAPESGRRPAPESSSEPAPESGRRPAPESSSEPAPADSSAGDRVLAFTEQTLLPLSAGPGFARSHPLTTFTHLFSGGYAAGYYSYLWSEVLEADAFTRFRKEGVLSRDVGKAYMDAILSRGDSADPEVLFREFMGRDPDPAALIERNLGAL